MQSQTGGNYLSTTNSTNYSASLSLTQNLFRGLSDYYKTSQATANTRVASATFQASKAKVSYDFITSYQTLLTSADSVRLTSNIVERRQANLRLVDLRFASGRENKGSFLLSQAYLLQAKYDHLLAKHDLELMQVSLGHFLSSEAKDESAKPINVTDPVPLKNPPVAPDFEALSIRTPEYQEISATVDANTASVGLARSAFLPSLNLIGSTGKAGPDFFPQSTNRWSVEASLTIPLFDGGKDYSSVNSSNYTKNSSLVHRVSVNQKQAETLIQFYQKYLESDEKLKVDASFKDAASLRAEIARSQYNNGLITFNDWDIIETDLINREKAYLQSRKERVLSEAAWNQALGQGVLE